LNASCSTKGCPYWVPTSLSCTEPTGRVDVCVPRARFHRVRMLHFLRFGTTNFRSILNFTLPATCRSAEARQAASGSCITESPRKKIKNGGKGKLTSVCGQEQPGLEGASFTEVLQWYFIAMPPELRFSMPEQWQVSLGRGGTSRQRSYTRRGPGPGLAGKL
jgi:hypothetical protein